MKNYFIGFAILIVGTTSIAQIQIIPQENEPIDSIKIPLKLNPNLFPNFYGNNVPHTFNIPNGFPQGYVVMPQKISPIDQMPIAAPLLNGSILQNTIENSDLYKILHKKIEENNLYSK